MNVVTIHEYKDGTVCVTRNGKTACARDTREVARLIQLALATPIISELVSIDEREYLRNRKRRATGRTRFQGVSSGIPSGTEQTHEF
ncbi:MAG: hypothetical protein IPF79_04780 [Ignavibacteria bacterium]|nr:hypothetical protein [Ignavibacteria bacterium]